MTTAEELAAKVAAQAVAEKAAADAEAKAAEEADAKEKEEEEKKGEEEDSAYKAILNLQETHKSETEVLKAEYELKLSQKEEELGKARYKIQDQSKTIKTLKTGEEGDGEDGDGTTGTEKSNPFSGMTSEEVIAKVAAGVAASTEETGFKSSIQDKLDSVTDEYHRKALEQALSGVSVKDPEVAFKMASSFVEQQVKDLQTKKDEANDRKPNPGSTDGASYRQTGEKEPDYLEEVRAKFGLKKSE